MPSASIQFAPPTIGESSDSVLREHSVHVVPAQTGVMNPRPFRAKVTALGKNNISTSARRTAWEVSHSADPGDPFDTPLPHDAQTGGKSYREFAQG